ncbi:hypothetical protein KGY64_07830 [Candidatus Bipolaricaulota bacterium]|nr:hypothetical protein [Candidatus Bipolaricaulota bacterium]
MRKLFVLSLVAIFASALSIGVVAGDSINESAQFIISNAYDMSVYNETALEFPADSEVSNVDSTGQYETTRLEVHLKHNYDVEITATGSSFDLDNNTSDYSSDYAIPAQWFFEWAEVNSPSESNSWLDKTSHSVSSPASTVEVTHDAEVDSSEGDVFGRISVKANRSGLDDPQGTYRATLDITVSDLGSGTGPEGGLPEQSEGNPPDHTPVSEN